MTPALLALVLCATDPVSDWADHEPSEPPPKPATVRVALQLSGGQFTGILDHDTSVGFAAEAGWNALTWLRPSLQLGLVDLPDGGRLAAQVLVGVDAYWGRRWFELYGGVALGITPGNLATTGLEVSPTAAVRVGIDFLPLRPFSFGLLVCVQYVDRADGLGDAPRFSFPQTYAAVRLGWLI